MIRIVLALLGLVLVVWLAVSLIPKSVGRARQAGRTEMPQEVREVLPSNLKEPLGQPTTPNRELRQIKQEVQQVMDQGASLRRNQLERDLTAP